MVLHLGFWGVKLGCDMVKVRHSEWFKVRFPKSNEEPFKGTHLSIPSSQFLQSLDDCPQGQVLLRISGGNRLPIGNMPVWEPWHVCVCVCVSGLTGGYVSKKRPSRSVRLNLFSSCAARLPSLRFTSVDQFRPSGRACSLDGRIHKGRPDVSREVQERLRDLN